MGDIKAGQRRAYMWQAAGRTGVAHIVKGRNPLGGWFEFHCGGIARHSFLAPDDMPPCKACRKFERRDRRRSNGGA